MTVAKHTILKYIARVRSDKPASQTWAIFLKNRAKEIWACDFLPVIDVWFRPLSVFFIVELASRRVVHFGVTHSPTDWWLAQQPIHSDGSFVLHVGGKRWAHAVCPYGR